MSASQCEVTFTVNGAAHTVSVYPMERLLDVLRTELRLTGAKEGCGEGECGSCSGDWGDLSEATGGGCCGCV